MPRRERKESTLWKSKKKEENNNNDNMNTLGAVISHAAPPIPPSPNAELHLNIYFSKPLRLLGDLVLMQ